MKLKRGNGLRAILCGRWRKTMFTGIISETARVLRHKKTEDGMLMTFEKPDSWSDLVLGESIATDGVCLTIAAIREHEYDCFLVPETLEKSSFGIQILGSVNLERALQLSSRIDGHIVQGHVDGVGTVTAIEVKDGLRMTIQFDPEFRKYVIEKGSITVNGVALTISNISEDTFEVAIIPFTLEHTTLRQLKEHDYVNLEFDLIGKYVLNGLKYDNPRS